MYFVKTVNARFMLIKFWLYFCRLRLHQYEMINECLFYLLGGLFISYICVIYYDYMYQNDCKLIVFIIENVSPFVFHERKKVWDDKGL